MVILKRWGFCANITTSLVDIGGCKFTFATENVYVASKNFQLHLSVSC